MKAQSALTLNLNEPQLQETAEWTAKNNKPYELWKVKKAIETYGRIRHVLKLQQQIVDAYRKTWRILKNDDHFTAQEFKYMQRVYSGILKESLNNLDQMQLVVKSFDTQMTDGK